MTPSAKSPPASAPPIRPLPQADSPRHSPCPSDVESLRNFGLSDLVAAKAPRPARKVPASPVQRHLRSPIPSRATLLCPVVTGHGVYEHVGIGRNLHRLPAQPRATTLFMSSIDNDRPILFPLQEIEDVRNIARRPRGLHFNPTVGKLVHRDFLTRLRAQMLQEILAQRDLSFGGDRERAWRRRNWLRLACTRNQCWIAVADAAATMMPNAVTAACSGAA